MTNTCCVETKRRTFRGLCFLAVIAATAACTTTMSGGKAGPVAEGLVYYLPAPHLYLSPQADGSVVVEVKHLPDPSNAYTLKINSYFSNATFEVGTHNGLLTTVNLDVDTSGVAASAVTAATDIQKARMTSDKEKETARKTQEDAKRTAVKAAAEAVTTQRETVALLEAKRKFYTDNPPKAGSAVDLQALDLEILQERLKLTQLEARLGLVKDKSTSAFNDPGQVVTSIQGTAHGPLLFRMLQDGEGVKLVAVGDQITVATPQAAAGASSVKATPAKIVIRKADAQRDVAIDFSQPVQLTAGSTKLMDPALGVSASPVVPSDRLATSLSADNKRLTIKLLDTPQKGHYRIDVEVTGPSKLRQQIGIPIDWLVD
jgi:hypothetical protein